LWCIEIDRSLNLLLGVTLDVLELLDRSSESAHALALAVACAAPELSQMLCLKLAIAWAHPSHIDLLHLFLLCTPNFAPCT